MDEKNKKIFFWIINMVLSSVMINLGLLIINQSKIIALITLFNGVALLYFSFYAHQIKINEERIKEIRDWIEEKEEVLNTLKDIAILKKISKIK